MHPTTLLGGHDGDGMKQQRSDGGYAILLHYRFMALVSTRMTFPGPDVIHPSYDFSMLSLSVANRSGLTRGLPVGHMLFFWPYR